MAKVGRAAYVASRQRVEAITASKTIASAETGELYLVDQSAGSVVITLPARQEGAYFKFLIGTELTDFNTKSITIQAAASGTANGEMVGSCAIVISAGNPTMGGDQVATTGDGHPQFIIESTHAADDLYAGSQVEVYCNGTAWIVRAELRTTNARLVGKFQGS